MGTVAVMSKSAAGLVEWALDAVKRGWVYWYGTCAYACTTALLRRKTEQYPAHYGDKRQATYKRHIEQGKTCADCVGLIKGYAWDKDGNVETRDGKYNSNGMPDTSAPGMYRAAKIKGKIAQGMPEIPGLLVWTVNKSHVGVYVGDGYVTEERGFAYGAQKNLLAKRSFVYWGICPYLDYTPEQIEQAKAAAGMTGSTSDAGGQQTTGSTTPPTLRKGSKGDSVKRMQEKLIAAGYTLAKYGADGKFGAETLAAVKAYQAAHGLTVDGICGRKTWVELLKA